MEHPEFIDLTADELRQFMAGHHEKTYLLVDVRQPREYAGGHIAGAMLLPLSELPARIAELPPDRDIVFY
ncbi:rhodanese-like domain-containing protein [Thermodesulfobacteriota bacterium B35]